MQGNQRRRSFPNLIKYTIPDEQIGPNAGAMKLEPTKAMYRAFRLISSPRDDPRVNRGDTQIAARAQGRLNLACLVAPPRSAMAEQPTNIS